VGEIDDEYDPPTTAVRFDRASGSAVLAGALHADEIRLACGFELPDGEYDTLAGFVLDRLGHLPVPGEVATAGGWRFEVTDMDRHRIAAVRVTAPPEERAP
jgi:CBS domain containing-hemolysin-like protein